MSKLEPVQMKSYINFNANILSFNPIWICKFSNNQIWSHKLNN